MSPIREFRLPDIGEGLIDAEIVRWLVDIGDHVQVDQPVVEVETAKATVELPCPYEGTVTSRVGAVGEILAVGSTLVTVEVTPERSQDVGKVLVGSGVRAVPPRSRRRVRSVPVHHAANTVVRPTSVTHTTPPALAGAPVAVVSPLVRRLARVNGIDLRTVQGTGACGLVLRADVERAVAAGRRADAVDCTETERIPIRSVRKKIADKLSRSRREIPDVTCWVDADATNLLTARDVLSSATERTGVLALLARICVAAALRFPELNSTVDTGGQEIIRFANVNLGFAAQTDKGLLVPVVHKANRMTLSQLSSEIRRLAESARSGTLTPSEMTGATITLNNYGRYGIDGATPIINHPEAAMLGVGRIVAKPWVHDGELAVRQVVQLGLTFDHRVCNGDVASGFLRYVADHIEQPLKLISAP
ncbi:dihydrolipoamide acetyltransferase family protein [Saccharopolyspora spinosa]|uniref:Dihydrolipoamide acetyltransferase component of pyruvate dehydrogenase complex n=1 Tax=Saccharopolyspora spinosa TaxID=60894 RepID=A0A2N3Y504_SACSN|nr:dihydrolipoamide acetyltransferase family protein [Saccharopolyspora spinosa]PKW18008.1 pyruvate dehydrogenase E2 component (dihydrolipoamide acetyltransferase) [Saccharopolyspora spinosa]